MKSIKYVVAISALAVCGSAAAELSANIGATSNYVWRGVTQTDDAAAISGGLDYAHDSGLYAGLWASNVDFDDDTTAEVDLYGGFANEFDNGLGYDIGLLYFAYPGAGPSPGDELDFLEVVGALSFGPVTAGVNYTVWKENDDADENDVYYHVSASTEVAPTWSLGATVGYYDFDDDTDYTHGQVDVTKSAGELGDFTLSVSVAEDDDDLGIDGDTLVFVSWAKSFD